MESKDIYRQNSEASLQYTSFDFAGIYHIQQLSSFLTSQPTRIFED